MCHKCVDILLPISSNKKDWNKAKHEWEFVQQLSVETNIKCICGCPIVKNYLLRNTSTDIEQILGSVCIENVFDECPKILDELLLYTCEACNKTIKQSSVKAHNRSARHTAHVEKIIELYRECGTCGKHKIPRGKRYNFHKVCKRCYMIERGFRECPMCSEFKKIEPKGTYCDICNDKRFMKRYAFTDSDSDSDS